VKGVEDGSLAYDFIEVMACPGGCIGGGGQPRSTDKTILQQRQAVRGPHGWGWRLIPRGLGVERLQTPGEAAFLR
jgi:hypothetical protein